MLRARTAPRLAAAVGALLAAAVGALLSVLLPACAEGDRKDCFQDLKPEACRTLCKDGETEMGAGTACVIWAYRDRSAAREAYSAGCQQHNRRACSALAGMETDPARRRELLREACGDGEHPSPCLELAELETDPTARKAALESGCLAGDEVACDRFAEAESDRGRRRGVFADACARRLRTPCSRVTALDQEADGGPAR